MMEQQKKDEQILQEIKKQKLLEKQSYNFKLEKVHGKIDRHIKKSEKLFKKINDEKAIDMTGFTQDVSTAISSIESKIRTRKPALTILSATSKLSKANMLEM